MPLNSEGFEVRRFTDINENLISTIEDQLNTELSRNPDAVITILLNNVASELTDLNELVKATYDSFDIYKAVGIQLDNRTAQLGIYRYGERPSRGYVQFTLTDDAPNGVTVPVDIVIGSQVKTGKGTQIETTDSVSISAINGCYSSTVNITTAQVGVSHSIEVNNTIFSYVPQIGDTIENVVDNFVTQLDSAPNASFSVVKLNTTSFKLTNSSTSNNGLRVELIDNPSAAQDNTITGVVGTAPAQTLNTGAITVNPNTVTSFITTIDGVDSVNNLGGFLLGNSIETDDELRTRYLDSLQVSGVATLDAIQDKISNLPDVDSAFVLENDTNAVVAGRPPHSFEVIVTGGDDAVIGQAIWDTKPASATTHGSIQQEVQDITGKVQYVKFSRPTPIYVWVEVTYDLYSEEVFPSDGETRIANALAEYSSELALGEDLYPQKFLGSVYKATDGLGTVSIRLATSLSSTVTVPDIAYTSSPIPVEDAQQPIVLSNKVTFV